MGQATVDLPDPLSSAPVSSANTDDLLAQLAGDEIERLLAEADAPPVDPRRGTAAAPAPMAVPLSQTPSSTSAANVSLLLEPTDSPTLPTVASAAGSHPKVDADLDALFTQLEGGAPAVQTSEPQLKLEAKPVDSEPSAADALAEEMLEDAATHSAGRTALASSPPGKVAHSNVENPQSSSILIRMLSWLDAPLNPYPDHVRDLVGKIAIVTTVNAAAVLAYVLLFRHR